MPGEPRPQVILVDTSAYFALKEFSFTDCTSFALMERMRITTAFAFDIHFRQYGRFTIIPE